MKKVLGLWQPFGLTCIEYLVLTVAVSLIDFTWSPWARVTTYFLVVLSTITLSMYRWTRKHGPHVTDRPQEGEPEMSIRLMRYHLKEAERMAKAIERNRRAEAAMEDFLVRSSSGE